MSNNLETVGDIVAQQYKVEQKQWLNPLELEAEFGFSRSTQSKMRMQSSKRKIPFSKIGKYIRYERVLILRWIKDHEVQGL